jgi:hypothetical protein
MTLSRVVSISALIVSVLSTLGTGLGEISPTAYAYIALTVGVLTAFNQAAFKYFNVQPIGADTSIRALVQTQQAKSSRWKKLVTLTGLVASLAAPFITSFNPAVGTLVGILGNTASASGPKLQG